MIVGILLIEFGIVCISRWKIMSLPFRTHNLYSLINEIVKACKQLVDREASIYLNLGGYLFCSLSKEAITNGDRTCVKSSCFEIRQPIRTAFAWADFMHWHPQTHQFKQYPSTWAVWCQDIQAWELCYHIDIRIAMLDDTRSEPSIKWVIWCMIQCGKTWRGP